jgi:hypothetical protein
MRLNRSIALTVAAAAAATALYASQSAEARGGTTLTFTNKLDTQQPVDVAPAGPSAGDSFYVSSHVVSGARGQTAASCTVISTVGKGVKQCEVDFVLAKGTITTRALTDNANTTVRLIVSGGTGSYAGKSGRGTLTPTMTGSDVVLHLH